VDAVLPEDCERARAHASLALDCELSELDRARLRSHLAGCASCDAFVGGLREVTHELRAAPLPTPSRPLVPRRASTRGPTLLAALAIVVAAAVGGVAGALRPAPAPALSTAASTAPVELPGARIPLRTPV
jgi:predicted anti-sigma-YlaC factor YlaD